MLEAAMGAGYAILLLTGANLHVRPLIAAVAILHVAFLLAPPILSTDLFSYLSYARDGALHGVDPYVHGPSVAPHDAAYALTAWKHAASAYGPLFTLASYPLAYVSLPLAVWGLKLMAFAASLGCVALVWRIAGQLGHSQARAVAVFGLNPVLLLWTLGGGHNDLLMLMLALAAVSFVIAKREIFGGATLVAAAAVKATVGIALPFLVLGARRGWRAALGAAGGAALVIGIAAVGFPGHALGVISVLRGSQSKLVAFDGIPNAAAQLVGLPGVNKQIRVLALALLAVALVVLIVLVRRGYDWVSACGWALVGVVVASPWFLAWYTVWPLPFAAVSRDRRLLVATLLLELYFVVNHVPGFTLLAQAVH